MNAALASANDGDTVLVPAGTCAYTTPTPYTPSVAVTKAVTLKGAGIDQTIISDETGTQSSEDPIELGSGARLTGFSFVDKRTVTDYKSAVATGGTNWRVDHCKFAPSIWVIGVAASGAGVIDHDVFVNTAHGVDVYGDGDAAWSAPSVIGTGNAVYMEDDTFDYASMNDGAYDAYDGATYVFRHNIVNGTNIGNHGFDSGGFRSPRSWEIYDNTFTNAGDHIFITINLRGGSGVIFNNTVQASGGSYDGFAILRNYRSDSGYTSADGDSWGTCDGTNAYDGNMPGWQGYPCKDQIGRGTDQTSFPAYLWNNTFKGSTSAQATIEGYEDPTRARTYHILKGRDYYDNTPKPGYTPFTYPHPLATAD